LNKKECIECVTDRQEIEDNRERKRERVRGQLKFWMGQRLLSRAYFGIAVTWNEQLR